MRIHGGNDDGKKRGMFSARTSGEDDAGPSGGDCDCKSHPWLEPYTIFTRPTYPSLLLGWCIHALPVGMGLCSRSIYNIGVSI